jgi:hypothetical protein
LNILELQDCCDVEELTEWAKREKLGARFQSGLEEVVKQGGLHTVTDTFLSGLGIMLPGMRKKILDAIKRKLVGNKKVRFGEIMKYDPILKKPSTKCPWVEIDEIEVRHDKETWQAAIRTWRFCTTGLDGLEEISLLRKAFDIWRPKPKAPGISGNGQWPGGPGGNGISCGFMD